MQNIVKVILFILVNIAGWYSIQVIAIMAVKYGFFPQLPFEHTEIFKFWYFSVGLWVLMGGALVSVCYFFAKDEVKNWLLFAPMYVTGSYCTGVLVYFNYFYAIA